MSRYFYSSKISEFLRDDDSLILGKLTAAYSHQNLAILQTSAWQLQIPILKSVLGSFPEGHIFLEFGIPRMGKRADCVLILRNNVLILEFKVGETTYPKYAIEQVVDYALDLKNFHEGSHDLNIFPILVSTEATTQRLALSPYQDLVYYPILVNKVTLGEILASIQIRSSSGTLDVLKWANSRYKPTPTIIEAAQALYNDHSVEDISRSDSGAINLSRTSECITGIIARTEVENQKSIIFVTGVPGAGKTLAGLNIATINMKKGDDHSVFLSGNHPLVEVLREALARNIIETSREKGIRVRKSDALRQAHAFIQNIHHFRDDYVDNTEAPVDNVVVFDEAQRAWTKKELTRFMAQKKGRPDFNMSEPQFLIEVMDRHAACTIVCLIGGGQEINRGEAGLDEWISALVTYFPHWRVYYSENIVNDQTYLRETKYREWLVHKGVSKFDLHLKVSVRSFRSEKLAAFVEAILALQTETARRLTQELDNDGYPIFITRDLSHAKDWLKECARGSERTGIVASSGAMRLRHLGLSVKSQIDPANWFLNDREDIRSSFFHEEVATEFDIQGLELDWVCVAWDGDFYYENDSWIKRKFKGTKWQYLLEPVLQRYLSNAYRVLLTRARQGMVIFVPLGDSEDKTRIPKFYDGTFNYLKSLGIQEI